LKGADFMQISDEEVLHIAKLARIRLSDNEIQDYKKNLEEILDFANTINNINTDNIGETIGINEKYNVFRKDEVIQETNKEDLLFNAPSQDDGMFRIPKVIN
jgi:aspartyl-tRNA(Asn)/glutamyl-tRNA(Gln) amidotransferase subunit C